MGIAILLSVAALLGCGGGDEMTGPENDPPTIAFAFNRLGVSRLIPVDLEVDVSDPNNSDVLSVSWKITRGNLTPRNAANTVMRWTPPAALGVDTVMISVTDGMVTRSVTAAIKVGTQATGLFARNQYIKSESPYILVGAGSPPIVSVDPGVVSTIEAGVEILVDAPETAFDVFGRLEAVGTANDPVVIRPNDRTLTCGDDRGWWKGFRGFSDAPTMANGDISMAYTDVWYGNNAIHLLDASSATLSNCNIRCSGDDGVKVESSGTFTIVDSAVTDGRHNGLTIKSLSNLPVSVSVTGCNISINAGIGIDLDLQDVSQQVPVTINDNIIEFNNLSGISLSNAVFPQIHGNTLSANGTSGILRNIQLQNGYPGGATVDTLDASMNFWGGPISNQSSIDATIRDSLDSGQVGTRVKSWPWCNDAGCTIIVP